MATRRAKPKSKPKSRLSPVARETRASQSTEITEADVNAAVSIIQRDYWQDVHYVGDDIKERIERGEISDDDSFREQVEQAVDGTQRVIYTWQSKLGMLATNHPDAYTEATGEPPVSGNDIDWARMMFYAMLEDVLAYIGSVDFE